MSKRSNKRVLREYVFEKVEREVIIAVDEKDARDQMRGLWGEDLDGYELTGVTSFVQE